MNSFRLNIAIRVLLLAIATVIFVYLVFHMKRYIGASLFAGLAGLSMISLWTYVEKTNRNLSRFFDSVRFDDFEMSFSGDPKLGRTFNELNQSFNKVLDSFRETRAQSEESLQYLNAILQHIPTGVLSFTEEGSVTLCNPAARRMLETPKLEAMSDIKTTHGGLFEVLLILQQKQTTRLYQPDSNKQLLLSSARVRLRGEEYSLISIQNIHEELEKKELEAWQTLAATLRHEIVNSITPITSIAQTLGDLLGEKLEAPFDSQTISEELAKDTKESLATIQNRGRALVQFVNEYKSLTQVPYPEWEQTAINDLIKEVGVLMKSSLEQSQVSLEVQLAELPLIEADKGLLENVLINLLKNAMEACKGREKSQIKVRTTEKNGEVWIHIQDNGKGIAPHSLDKIFIPFYSTKTKEGGTGIGLSIVRKIILLHNGRIDVASELGKGTQFSLSFPVRRVPER